MFSPRNKLRWLYLGVMTGTTAFLYFFLFLPERVPIWLSGDQTVYLLNAARMLQGQIIYRDFFQFTFPGTEIVYLVLFKFFGTRSWIPNGLLIVLAVGLVWLCLMISRTVLSGSLAVLPALLFLTFPYRSMLNASHHWFSALCVTAAIACVIQERGPFRLAAAGTLCGLAAFFTQARGFAAVLGFAAFLFWQHRRKPKLGTLWKGEASLFAGFLTAVVAMLTHFILQAGWRRFWYCTVVFALRYYPADVQANSIRTYVSSMPLIPPWHRLPAVSAWIFVHALLPLVYVAFMVTYRRRSSALPAQLRDRLMLLNITGTFLFLGVAPAASWFRLNAVSLPGIILLVWLLGSVEKYGRGPLTLLWLAGIATALVQPWPARVHGSYSLELPAGRTGFFTPEARDKYQWIRDHTRPADYFFDGATLPRMYFPLGLRNPASVPFLTTTDYTRPEQVRDVMDALGRNQVEFVVWSPALEVPKANSLPDDHLGPLRSYLRTHYQVVKTFADGDQVWERSR